MPDRLVMPILPLLFWLLAPGAEPWPPADPLAFDDRIEVQLAGGLVPDWRDGRCILPPGTPGRADFEALLAGCTAVEPLFPVPRARLDAWHAELVRAAPDDGASAPHLGTWLRLRTTDRASAEALVGRLLAHPAVAHAYREPIPVTTAAPDIPPPTPDFRPMQTYRGPAPIGMDSDFANAVVGGRGRSVRVFHLEADWLLGHEDLSKVHTGAFLGAPSPGRRPEADHGAGVIGILAADRNDYGITGMADECGVVLGSMQNLGGIGPAIAAATAAARPGDVIALIIGFDIRQFGPDDVVPLEYFPSYFQAIRTATGLGVFVVESAGNGGNDLDHPRFDGIFDRAVRDSGAFLCGGSDGARLRRRDVSNYGSRITCSGWGSDVTTTGFGTLFEPNGDARQSYTEKYGGTSGGASTVLGVVTAFVGAVRQQQGRTPSVAELDGLLRRHVTPLSGRIGGRPDLRRMLAAVGLPDGLVASEHVVARGGTATLELSGPAHGQALLIASPGLATTQLGLNRPLHLDPAVLISLGGVPLGGGGRAAVSFTVPNQGALAGLALRFQALTLGPAGGSARLTSSTEIVVD